ncbi:retropepsin-like aspartic protease [Paenibacillus sp. GbtcB18]|uniref:retropepsin-like aspartic protease n=1 Tax=Paenibacillus sp. GbtcB18 TaxID=2824763 RepID=UPI001C2F5B5F|nr:retropepsin-like aspartic protease [Paenibacillus sp. GbtcB18]
MNIEIKYGLPFVEVVVCYRGEQLHLKHVLLDTGSAGTIFSADVVDAIGVKVEPEDVLNKIRGVGGVEIVYSKYFDFVRTGEVFLEVFEVEIGKMNYGLEIDGIIGFDFIRAAGLVINSKELTLSARV